MTHTCDAMLRVPTHWRI